jgi:hypothetical protein
VPAASRLAREIGRNRCFELVWLAASRHSSNGRAGGVNSAVAASCCAARHTISGAFEARADVGNVRPLGDCGLRSHHVLQSTCCALRHSTVLRLRVSDSQADKDGSARPRNSAKEIETIARNCQRAPPSGDGAIAALSQGIAAM